MHISLRIPSPVMICQDRDPPFPHTIGISLRCTSECLQTMTDSNIYIAPVLTLTMHQRIFALTRNIRLGIHAFLTISANPQTIMKTTFETTDFRSYATRSQTQRKQQLIPPPPSMNAETNTHVSPGHQETTHSLQRFNCASNVTYDFTAPRTVPRPAALAYIIIHHHTTKRHMSHVTVRCPMSHVTCQVSRSTLVPYLFVLCIQVN